MALGLLNGWRVGLGGVTLCGKAGLGCPPLPANYIVASVKLGLCCGNSLAPFFGSAISSFNRAVLKAKMDNAVSGPSVSRSVCTKSVECE